MGEGFSLPLLSLRGCVGDLLFPSSIDPADPGPPSPLSPLWSSWDPPLLVSDGRRMPYLWLGPEPSRIGLPGWRLYVQYHPGRNDLCDLVHRYPPAHLARPAVDLADVRGRRPHGSPTPSHISYCQDTLPRLRPHFQTEGLRLGGRSLPTDDLFLKEPSHHLPRRTAGELGDEANSLGTFVSREPLLTECEQFFRRGLGAMT